MKMSKLIGTRFKEKPADCTLESHTLMVRGGYIRPLASGIFSVYPLLRRVTRKIEHIIGQEMDALGGQEVTLPVVMPAALWQTSGRYDTMGSELLRFRDRGDTPMVLGMTHEEAAVHLVHGYGRNRNHYPFMIYQLQTKFRDEARPRGGLIRVREFTMKDAYSFHTSQEDLAAFYRCCLEAYHRIFARVGIPEVATVAAHSGVMGGSVSHEFMLITPAGEDSVAICGACGYSANAETGPRDTGLCPRCGSPSLALCRGIEVGNIFQLGDRYTRAMGMQYVDAQGVARFPLMGCYGIGIGRLAASICQVRHDVHGPIWPMSIAPWQVHLCCQGAGDEGARACADTLYQLMARGVEVLYDDRAIRPGVMFSEADLVGAPIRVLISRRSLEADLCEIATRDRSVNRKVRLDEAPGAVVALVEALSATTRLTPKPIE